MWTPIWLQQVVLKDQAELKVCAETRTTLRQETFELRLSVQEVRAASADLQHGILQLQTQLAVTRTEALDAQARATRNLYLAIGSAGAAVVAVSILLIEHL